jgi:hypothetical protein
VGHFVYYIDPIRKGCEKVIMETQSCEVTKKMLLSKESKND